MGRVNYVKDQSFDITSTFYDARGLVESVWQGTFMSNLLEVESYTYDADGNTTSTTDYVDANAADNRVTLYGYDWRDRQLWTMVDDHTPDPNNPGSTRKTYTFNTYDNLDEVTNVTRYYDLANTVGLPNNAPNAGDPVIGRSGAAYDNLGRQYQSIAYNQPGTTAIVSNTWYDGDGDVIMSLPGGTQEFTKTVYDGLGDPVTVYDGYDPTNSSVTYAAASSVSSNVILSQTVSQYDAAGDDIFDTGYDRLPSASDTDTGGLDTLSSSDSRVSYSATWYDGIGRTVATTDFGALSSAPTRSDAAPTSYDSSGATQVTLVGYNARGEAAQTFDAAGREQFTVYDDAGRPIQTIQNYANGGAISPDNRDENIATVSTYSAGEHVAATTTETPSPQGLTYTVGSAVGDYSTTGILFIADANGDGGGRTAAYREGWGNTGWQFYDSGTWTDFTPGPDDIILGTVSGSSFTPVTGSAPQPGTMQTGYYSGNLAISGTFDSDTGLWTWTPTSGYDTFTPYAVAQTTQYVYDTQATSASPDLYSYGELTAVIYPDSTATYDSSTNGLSGSDLVKYTYDRQGEMTSMTDQNGTTYTYAYDGVGRLLVGHGDGAGGQSGKYRHHREPASTTAIRSAASS